jgi:hypothetical protein
MTCMSQFNVLYVSTYFIKVTYVGFFTTNLVNSFSLQEYTVKFKWVNCSNMAHMYNAVPLLTAYFIPILHISSNVFKNIQ